MGMPRIDVDARSAIRDAWMDLVREKPKLRQRDAAELLGVSEGELVASRCGDGVLPLDTEWPRLLRGLVALGPVKTITRNAYAVHETVGLYEEVTFAGSIALVQSEKLDLRLMLDRWHRGFAVTDRSGSAVRHSLQFYDVEGGAIHKIYPEAELDAAAFHAAIAPFVATDDKPALLDGPADGRAFARRNGNGAREDRVRPAVDRAALLDDWARLEDTHDFGAMLGRHHVERAAAMAMVEGVFTTALPGTSYNDILDRLREAEVPVMVFVGNPGAVQIHTGPFGNVRKLGNWANVLDADFNLHVVEDAIANIWAVTKPTRDGVVTSIEAYAHDGTEIAVLYGRRKPGVPELAEWKNAVDSMRDTLVAS